MGWSSACGGDGTGFSSPPGAAAAVAGAGILLGAAGTNARVCTERSGKRDVLPDVQPLSGSSDPRFALGTIGQSGKGIIRAGSGR